MKFHKIIGYLSVAVIGFAVIYYIRSLDAVIFTLLFAYFSIAAISDSD